jgi:hypothetical protein
MKLKNRITSPGFLKIQLGIFLFLDFLCFVTHYLEDLLFSFKYYESFVWTIFCVYVPMIIVFSLIIFYQIILAFIKLNDNQLKTRVFITELLFCTAVASEIIISTQVRPF